MLRPGSLMIPIYSSCIGNWIFICSDNSLRASDVYNICKLNIIGSDNGMSPGQHQAIIWTNGGILSIEPLVTNFNETLIKIHTFSLKKMHLKMPSMKWQPFCLVLNVIMTCASTSPRHYLNQCWYIVTKSSNNNIQRQFSQNSNGFILLKL